MLELVVVLNDDMTQANEALGLTPSRTHLLWEVGQRGPVPQRVLADALKVTPRAVTGLVDALVDNVLSGSGRVKLDDELVELAPLDAVRVSPGVARSFEAGWEGLEVLTFGPHIEGDSETVADFWEPS